MTFDKEKQKQAIEWLKEKCPELKCDCCGKKDWELAGDLIAPITVKRNQLTVGSTSYPFFMILCKNCSNAKFFNAVMAGIVKDPS